jgi:hypothetical protein
LKLEIREIQKYVFDLIECLLTLSQNDTKASKKIKEMLSTGVVVSSIISEISKIEEDQEFETKILTILGFMLTDVKFYQIFRKNKGIDLLIEYHDLSQHQPSKLQIAKIILDGLKAGHFRPFQTFSRFVESILTEIS